MVFLKKISLRPAWYGLIILASMLPAVVLSPWLYQQAHGLLMDRAMLSEKMFHQVIETRLHLETKRLVSVLQNKSDPIAYFVNQNRNIDFMRKLVKKIDQREPLVNTTTIYDHDANIILSTHHGEHIPVLIDRASPAFVIPMHKRVFIGSPERLSDKHLEFLIAVPLIADNKSIGVMISTVNIDAFLRNIRATLPEHNSKIYLIDGRGSLLTPLPGSKYQQGALLSDKEIVRTLLAGKDWHRLDIYEGVDGKKVFGIATLIRELRWGIISEIPSGSIMAPITSILITLIIIVVMLHALFGLISLMFTKRLLNPVSELATAVKCATQGDYEHKLKPSRYREIDDLTVSFSTMIHEIEKRESSLRKLSSVIEQTGDGVVVTDRTGTIEYVNPAFTRLTGYSTEEVIGQNPRILKSGNQDAIFYKNMWDTLLSGKVWQGKVIDRKKDGTFYPVMLTISPIRNDAGEITHFAATHADLTAYDEVQAKFEQAQKMEAVGTLVGGIAHNFNNMLAGIIGNLYLLRSKMQGMPELVDRVRRVENLSHEAADMISELLIFARKGIVEKKDIDLAVFLKAAYRLAAITLPENIKVTQEFTSETLPIYGDANQIQQVLLNLLNNARDAVADVNEPGIGVCLERFEVDGAFVKRHQDIDGNTFKKGQTFARLVISDNGCGIPEEQLSDIFEPFFTTKEVGIGTGLGLAMSYGTVREHGGVLDVESKVGEGSVFSVYLPLVQPQATTIKAPDEKPVTHGRGETILLADDEQHVRETVAEVLETIGYKVLQAKDGREALDIFKTNQEEIALAMLDVVMPHYGGIQLAERIREMNPDMPVIFMTGYDNEQVLGSSDQPRNSKVLTKPVQFEALSHSIRQVLD